MSNREAGIGRSDREVYEVFSYWPRPKKKPELSLRIKFVSKTMAQVIGATIGGELVEDYVQQGKIIKIPKGAGFRLYGIETRRPDEPKGPHAA